MKNLLKDFMPERVNIMYCILHLVQLFHELSIMLRNVRFSLSPRLVFSQNMKLN